MNVNKYRFDNRTKEEFERDIKNGTAKETELLKLWLKKIYKTTRIKLTYKYNGCGPDGEYLSSKKVNTNADFIVDSVGLIEVKFSKLLLTNFFHLKVQQINSYIKQNAYVLMINGAETKTPSYILLSPNRLANIVAKCKVVAWAGFGGKKSYRIPINMFRWKDLL